MSSSRRKARGAYAPSVDDDSIPALDGGWIKDAHYGVRSTTETTDKDSSVSKQDSDNASKDGDSPIDFMSKQQARETDDEAHHDVDDGREVSPGRAADDSPGDSDGATRDGARDDTIDATVLIEKEIAALSIAGASDEDQAVSDDSLMEAALRQIVSTFRKKYDDDKKRFQNALQLAFRQRLSQIEKKATSQLRRKLHKARKKDKLLIAKKDARLNALLVQLSALATEVDKQRAQIRKSSKYFEQKIVESDLVTNELHDLGRELSRQAESLGDILVDDSKSHDHPDSVE